MLQNNEATAVLNETPGKRTFENRTRYGGKKGAREKLYARWEAMSQDAMTRLHQLVHSQNEPVALAACKEVLDRTYGKARTQAVVDVQHTDMTMLHLAALQALAAKPVAQAIKDVTQQAKIEAPRL